MFTFWVLAFSFLVNSRILQRGKFTFIWFANLDFGILNFLNDVFNVGYCFFGDGFTDGICPA